MAECEGKRAKLKKASLAVLHEVQKRNGGALSEVLVNFAGLAPEKAAVIAKQVEDSLQGGAKKVADKSSDFRSFLKQQKTGGQGAAAEDQLL